MMRPLVLSLAVAAFTLGPALALHAEADRDAALVPYLSQGFREASALVREDPALGTVHAVVLEEGEGAARHRCLLFVFATKGDRRTLLHTGEYAWATLERLADVDGDGRLDLVVRAGNGGTCWACGWVEALTLTAGRPERLIGPERFQALEDLDGDGKLEAIEHDAKWEFFEGLSHASSPRVERLYRRTGDQWQDASAQYPKYYEKTLETLEKQLAKQADASPDDWDDQQMGSLISILLNRIQLGQKDDAWKAFQKKIDAWRARMTAPEADGKERLDAIVDALKRELKVP